MDDVLAFQYQRHKRYCSGHLRPPGNRAQERHSADLRHEVGRDHGRGAEAAR